MDKELVLKESKEVLALGQGFLEGLIKLRAYDKDMAKEIENLIDDGDEEFTTLKRDFQELLSDLGM